MSTPPSLQALGAFLSHFRPTKSTESRVLGDQTSFFSSTGSPSLQALSPFLSLFRPTKSSETRVPRSSKLVALREGQIASFLSVFVRNLSKYPTLSQKSLYGKKSGQSCMINEPNMASHIACQIGCSLSALACFVRNPFFFPEK